MKGNIQNSDNLFISPISGAQRSSTPLSRQMFVIEEANNGPFNHDLNEE